MQESIREGLLEPAVTTHPRTGRSYQVAQLRSLRVDQSKHVPSADGLVFHWTTHHVQEEFLACLARGTSIDGSSQIVIRCGPRGSDERYSQVLGVSIYYAEDFDLGAYASASSQEREATILSTIESALTWIAQQAGTDCAPIAEAAQLVRSNNFVLCLEQRRLGRSSSSLGLRVSVYRWLSSKDGEDWRAVVARRKDGQVVGEVHMDTLPCFLNRKDFFRSSLLEGNFYSVRDRLDTLVFRLDLRDMSVARVLDGSLRQA